MFSSCFCHSIPVSGGNAATRCLLPATNFKKEEEESRAHKGETEVYNNRLYIFYKTKHLSFTPELWEHVLSEASHILTVTVSLPQSQKHTHTYCLARYSYWTTRERSPWVLYTSALHVCAESPAEWLKWETLASLCLKHCETAAATLRLQTLWLLRQTAWSGTHISTRDKAVKY